MGTVNVMSTHLLWFSILEMERFLRFSHQIPSVCGLHVASLLASLTREKRSREERSTCPRYHSGPSPMPLSEQRTSSQPSVDH